MSADKNLYRVWPDGWVQDASEEPYSWRSDDLLVIAALPCGAYSGRPVMTNQQGAPEALRPIARYKIGYATDD